MPNVMIHERIGYLLSKELQINSYDYYLGLLAPDSPNLNGFAEKNIRWQAHVRKKNLQEWRKSLIDFYKNNEKNYPRDFLLGYFIHILTDIVYDDYFYEPITSKIKKDYPSSNTHELLRMDMNKYYFKEIKIIREILEQETKTYSINGISQEQMLKWKEKQVNDWIRDNSSIYHPENVLNLLTKKVSEELLLLDSI